MMKRVVLLSLLDTNESSNTPTIVALDKIKERIECNGKKDSELSMESVGIVGCRIWFNPFGSVVLSVYRNCKHRIFQISDMLPGLGIDGLYSI